MKKRIKNVPCSSRRSNISHSQCFISFPGDVSSISGSDDDEGDEDKQNEDLRDVENDVVTSEKEFKGASSTKQRDSHKVYFRNKAGELISVHRCLLHHKKVCRVLFFKTPSFVRKARVPAYFEITMSSPGIEALMLERVKILNYVKESRKFE